MATDYDAPRRQEDESDSLDALKQSIPSKPKATADDENDTSEYALADGPDLSDAELDVVVLPPQENEFTCVECFLVKHRTQFDHESSLGPVCKDCAA
ncbi:DUF4193 family protein [Pseudoclavibacter sp. 13-3]|uniref:DUF4193 family protein n=1 Tax=Pseudoclavibacter sp. 13-3 TaxID=2901228 RepID=UPI001E5E2EFF|nr:DUF4193 family protein [Pseudoclavibacter sp. 13-3]MCD7100493.1 DUF4193 domain-containing protein [Pseudoclavibacter sp. 13-3]